MTTVTRRPRRGTTTTCPPEPNPFLLVLTLIRYDYEGSYDPKAGLETEGSDEVESRRSRRLSEESTSTSHDYVLSLADSSLGEASTASTGWIGGEQLRVTIAPGSLIGSTGGLMESNPNPSPNPNPNPNPNPYP